jgi:outer membrane protein assembly factor BamB
MFRTWLLALFAVLGLFLALPVLADAPEPHVRADWPQWRGPKRDAVCTEKGLLREWPEGGPKLLWKAKNLGQAWSSVVVVGNRIWTMGDRDRKQVVLCLDAGKEGKEVWSAEVGRPWSDGARSTPTVDGKLLYALGTHGDLVCLESATGKEKWRKNFGKDFKGRMMSGWGYCESPLVDGERLICTPGGDDAALVALDRKTGEEVWRARVRNAGGAGYASPVVAEVKGVRMYITWLGSGLVGVRAKDGKLLWRYDRNHNTTANIPTPIVKGDLVFSSTGYGAGSALLRLMPDGKGGVKAKEEYFLDGGTMQNHHGGMVLVGGHVYCGREHNQGYPTCVELKTGKIAWKQGRGPGSGSAAVLYADGHLYFRYDDNVMALIEASPKGYRLKSKFTLPDDTGRPGWQHPVIADGKLYLRGSTTLLCYDIKRR